MFNELKTTARILGDVLQGKSDPRTLIPELRNYVKLEIIRADGTRELLADGYNSRVNAGALWQAGIMGSATAAPANYIALSTTVLTPSQSDTTLSGEITSGSNAGLARSAATYGGYTAPTSLNGAASYTLTKSFTSSGTATVNSAAIFNASSGGSLFVESNLSPSASLASGDTLNVTWTINI